MEHSKFFNKFSLIFIICLLNLQIFCVNVERDIYQDLINEAKGLKQPPKPEVNEDEVKIGKRFEKSAVSPQVVGRFFCDPEVKLNSVRQDVMTINNYSK